MRGEDTRTEEGIRTGEDTRIGEDTEIEILEVGMKETITSSLRLSTNIFLPTAILYSNMFKVKLREKAVFSINILLFTFFTRYQ